MTRLIIWRHGETAWNANHRIQGQTDVELSELGRTQAIAAASILAGMQPDVLISSDLRRATETAAPLAELTGLAVSLDPRLRERAYGDWEGLTGAEIAKGWPEAFERWRRHDTAEVPGLEDHPDVDKRMLAGLQDAADAAPGGTAVVVSHGGAARRGVGALLGWPDAAVRTMGALANCHWTELRLNAVRGWILAAYNIGAASGTGRPWSASQ